MIAACILTNQEKSFKNSTGFPPLHQVYLFESDVLVRQKNKTREFNVQNSSNFFACFAPYTDSTVDAIDGPGTSTYPQATSLDLQSPVVEVCNPNSSK